MEQTAGWHDSFLSLLQEGKTVEITTIGTSMFPLFITPEDRAVLAAADPAKLRRGDVVLYRRDSGMLVIHRICRKTADGFYMTGDNQTALEGPLRPEQLLAVMVSFRRKGHFISCRNPVYIIGSRLWLFLRPIRPFLSRPLGKLWRFFKKKKNG